MKIAPLSQEFISTSARETQSKQVDVKDAKLEKSAKELEGLFLTFVLKAMEKTIPKEKENSNSVANMMFSTVLGKSIAEQGGIGLAKFFYNTLSQNSEKEMAELKEKINDPTIININPVRMAK